MDRLQADLVLGRGYRLVARIASGGMGHVWEAFDETLHRRVAVKVLRAHIEDERLFAERFRAEARHTAGLSHPNIATVFDYGEQDGYAFLVMELVAGAPLSDLLRERGALDPELARTIAGQAALALGAAHAAGVVHRDVKPANVMLRSDGQVKLTDFGIARALDSMGHTRTGEVLGTPYYLSPEQALGRPTDASSDVYSLGVVLYELLTGFRPFDKGTPVATALAHIGETPPPLPAHLDPELRAVVEACLRKDPHDRPPDGAAVAAALGVREGVGHRGAAAPVAGVDAGPPNTSSDLGSADARPVTLPTLPIVFDTQATQVQWQPVEGAVPLTDLETLLATLSPRRNPGEYAAVSVREVPAGVHPVLALFEREGLTLVLPEHEARERGLDYEVPLAWITLDAYRSVMALGYVPAITTALHQANVPAVASMGRWHTHLFVPAAFADNALRTLVRLSRAHRD